jgi:hypothetical protein
MTKRNSEAIIKALILESRILPINPKFELPLIFKRPNGKQSDFSFKPKNKQINRQVSQPQINNI